MKIHSAKMAESNNQNAKKPGEILESNKQGITVATGQGSLLITEIQFAGGKRMKVQDALNGKHKSALEIGQCLGMNKDEQAL